MARVKQPEWDMAYLARELNLSLEDTLEAMSPDGTTCARCHGQMKVYRRAVNSDIARTLIYALPKFKAHPDGWLHLSQFLTTVHNFRTGDYHKAKYWRLIRAHPGDRPAGKSSNGRWQLTALGIAFAEDRYAVPNSHVLVYCDRIIPETWYGGPRTVRQALSKKFNYDELMANITQ